jgi:hypothetical protein
MKKIIIGILVAVLLIGGGVMVWSFFFVPAVPSEEPGPITLPQAGDTPGGARPATATSTSLTTIDGRSIPVRDFSNDTDSIQDANNPQYYRLGSNDAFAVTYISNTDFFIIEIQEEPIGPNRKKAELYLEQKLGISRQSMCVLQYQIVAPWWVNSLYAGQNLGFSFCPGAVKLPE